MSVLRALDVALLEYFVEGTLFEELVILSHKFIALVRHDDRHKVLLVNTLVHEVVLGNKVRLGEEVSEEKLVRVDVKRISVTVAKSEVVVRVV